MSNPTFDDAVRDVISSSVAPAVILELPSERIVAASTAAERLLADDGEIVGHSLEEFAADRPTGALELVLAGRLTGYEAERVIRRPGASSPFGSGCAASATKCRPTSF